MITKLKMEKAKKSPQRKPRKSGASPRREKVAKNKFSENFKDIKLDLHGVRLPSFHVPNEEKQKIKISEDVDNYDFLRALCFEGFKGLDLKKGTKEYDSYVKRAKYELTTLKELGFIDYILLVWDVINFCKKEDIPTGIGRGSAAGSIVLYLIGVTKIDPVKYDLYFERFVSKIRAKKKVVDGITYLDGSLMCDVDLDICYYNRQKVLKYLEDKFEGKTSKILTFNTLSTKLLIKECGKIISEIPDGEMTRVSALVPKMFGQVKDLRESYDEVEEFRDWCDENKEVYETALKLRGLVKNKGVHPSAVSISYGEMDESCPTELTSDKSTFVSSFDMNWVSEFNVKLDILGLRSVSVVDQACKLIGIKVEDIDTSDLEIYRRLQDLKTPHGLFQIEAETNFKVCRKVRPQNLEQLSAVLALARPGALSFVDQYARFVETGDHESIHPFFDDILSSTGGVCLYQEQMMKMAHKIGFSLDEAEILRRIVGKKKTKEVRQWKKKIRQKIEANKLEPEVGDVLWSVLEDSANYSFNKSHSIAYASLAACTAWLKFKYPKEFFMSLLQMTRYEPDPVTEISKIHKEFHLFDLELHPPHIIKSKMDFNIEGNGIRFGLLSIKGISEKSIEKLNNFKDEYSNKFEIFQAAEEASIGMNVLCPLIQAGALEGFSQSRAKVVYEAQLWSVLTKKEKMLAIPLAVENDYDLVKVVKYLSSAKDGKGKALIKSSRMQTMSKKSDKYKEIYNHNKSNQSFTNWYYEKNLLGYTYGKTLFDIFSGEREGLSHIETVDNMSERTRCVFVGRVEEDAISRTSKNGNRYGKLLVGDETKSIRVMIFKEKLDRCKEMNGGLPKSGEIVIVKGTKMDEPVFADVISVQDRAVIKYKDLKK
jgi:DNA polymerase-3 subunit alpha